MTERLCECGHPVGDHGGFSGCLRQVDGKYCPCDRPRPADVPFTLKQPDAHLPRLDDHQVGGDHYRSLAVTPWQALEAWLTSEGFEGYLAGNAVKYLARYRDKGGTQDLQKAQHYIARLIAHRDARNDSEDSDDGQ
jgi:hypothetical protein